MSRKVSVSVPATSANLGPGYDAFGLALEIRDFVTATFTDDNKVTVDIIGQGAGELPKDATHLIAKTIIDACKAFGTEVTGLHVKCKNAIPQGRGLGSSAAAIVAGLVLASELTYARASEDELLQMANAIEGHPDNVAACLLGALTIAWLESDNKANSVSMNVHEDIFPVLGIPQTQLDTHKARGLIPETIPHVDAAFNAGRAALLVAAMIGNPDFLLEATQDKLHQPFRAAAYPESMDLIGQLREVGIAACISGAGPTIIALTTSEQVAQASEIITKFGFTSAPVAVADQGAIAEVIETGEGQSAQETSDN
jgi:homoserine kinase